MNKREILKNELQNWFYKKMSVLPSENLLNNLTDKIYYNKQLSLCAVGSSLPTKEEMFIEELQRYKLEKQWDERVNRSDFSKGFIECYKWITKQDFKVR
jgi:hypothetical protein